MSRAEDEMLEERARISTEAAEAAIKRMDQAERAAPEPITVEEPAVKRAQETAAPAVTRAELDAEWTKFYELIDPEAFEDTKRELDRLITAERALIESPPKNQRGWDPRALESLRTALVKRENEVRTLKKRLELYHALVQNVFSRRGFLEHEHKSAKELLSTTSKDVP